MKYRKWVVVGLLWIVALLNYMDRQMLSTMRIAMQADITELESAVSFGKLMAVFLWVYGFLSPFAGAVADRINRKAVIIGSLGVWSAVTLLMGHCHTFSQLYWLRALMGVSEALYIPAGLSLIADYHPGKTRSLATGIHMTGIYIGQAAGGFGAGLASALTWQGTFHWFGVIGIAYAVVLLFFLKDIRPGEPRAVKAEKARVPVFKAFGYILSSGAFWAILFFFASTSLPGWATKNWLPTLFNESLGIPMTKAGPVSTITIAAASFMGVILGGTLSDRWVLKNLRGRVYTSAIGLGMMIPSLLLLGFSHSMAGLVAAGVLFGLGYGMFDTNTMPILCQFIPGRMRGTAYGILNMTGVFFGALVTTVLGALADGGRLGFGFALCGVMVALALAVQLTVLKPQTDNME